MGTYYGLKIFKPAQMIEKKKEKTKKFILQEDAFGASKNS